MRRLAAQAFSWSMIELFYCNGKIFFGGFSKICSFRKILSKKAIGVFIRPPLPSRIGISEIDFFRGKKSINY